ncbi:MAG: hypothetical protein V7L22_15900 [Nostoc sp.]|uniref:hypothetical protein n=1 Tax=Nostoc sp. TaxID=1180 RepID=UPI002FF711A6
MSSPVLQNPTTAETSYVLLYNISWEQLEQLDVTLTGTGARLTYLDNILEIISPLSDDHEDSKKPWRCCWKSICGRKRSDFMDGEVQL